MLWSVKRQGPTIYARPWSAKIFFIRASLRFSRMEQKTQAQCAKRVLFRFQGSSLFAVCICGIKQITQPPCAKRENSLWRIFECRMHPSMGAAQRKKKRKKKTNVGKHDDLQKKLRWKEAGTKREAQKIFFYRFTVTDIIGAEARSTRREAGIFFSLFSLWTLGAGTRRVAPKKFFFAFPVNLGRGHEARSAKFFFFRFPCEPWARARGAKRGKFFFPCFPCEP